MTTNNTIDRLVELLRNSNMSWMLPNLRQDFVVWNSIIQPLFFDRFIQLIPSGYACVPDDFSASRLALIAIDQVDAIHSGPQDLLDLIDSEVLQRARRGFNDQSIFQTHPQDLASAGMIALVLADIYRTTGSWNNILNTIQDYPAELWLAPFVCLYGYLGKDDNLLKALVQPSASAMRLNLAVHVVLSNPILPNDQIATLLKLCHGEFGDLLPASDNLSLIRSLSEQRPDAAVIFCQELLGQNPSLSKPGQAYGEHLIQNMRLLEELIFQIEVNKIAGRMHEYHEFVKTENQFTKLISASLNNHLISHLSKIKDEKSTTDESSAFQEDLVHLKDRLSYYIDSPLVQAESALILTDQGNYEAATQLLPDSDTVLPNDPLILFAIAKLAVKLENIQRAVEVTTKLTSILEQRHPTHKIPVWGDQLSMVNLGILLLDLRMPEQANSIFLIASEICPNDACLLQLLAESYISSHKNQEAIEVLHTLVSLNPGNLEYRREFANSLEGTGDWESALNERRYIVEANHDHSKYLPIDDMYAYARCALNANQLDLTLNICEELLGNNQDDSHAMVFSGEAYLRSGKIDTGMEYLNRATQVSPHLPEAWLALAEAQKNICPTKTVIETLTSASQAVPNSSEIHFALGELYLLDGAPTLALPELQSAVRHSPENPKILINLGRALKLIGNIDESREALSKAYRLEPNYPGLAQLYAKLLIDMGELEDAIPPLEKIISLKSSTDISVYLDYARSILSLNKLESPRYPPMKALIALNEVLRIDPNIAEAKALIAEILAASGDKEMAFQAYREALDTHLVNDKNWLERLSYGFGCVASSVGKHDVAIAALQEAAQVNPSNPSIFKALSSAYLAADLPEDAIHSARNVLILDGDDPDNLAWFASQATDLISNRKSDFVVPQTAIAKTVPSEALNALTKAIQLAPTRTDLLIQMGNFQASVGALDEAQETFASIALLDYATIDDLKSASDYLCGIGNYTAAIACLENAAHQNHSASEGHDASIYFKLAQAYVKINDHTSAINTLDQAMEVLPDDGSLITQKINILLDLGQPIEALNCIEAALQYDKDRKYKIDLFFLASMINRTIGDLYTAVKYAQKGIKVACEAGREDDISSLPIRFQTQIAEIYRALIQPEYASRIIANTKTKSASDFLSEQDYLDFICLQAELSLETGDQIRPEIQDLQLDIKNSNFSRLMAIKARLMYKAGNYMQAEQILQIAVNRYIKQEADADLSSWSTHYMSYLTMNSLVEASLDLGLWDQAVSSSLRLMESTSSEPLAYLNLAKAIVLEAEYYNLCEVMQVSKHKPSLDSVSKDTYDQFKKYLENLQTIFEPYQNELHTFEYELSNEQIYKWQARADIAFKQYEQINTDPLDILNHQATPGNAAAMIYHLHQINQLVPNSNSINQIIKIARLYPRNPLVLLQVALAIHEENPAEAMKSLQSVLEQNPVSHVPIIAFCNFLLAKIALNLEGYAIAQQAINRAIEIWPDEPEWHILTAQILQRIYDQRGAIVHLLEATRLNPTGISYHLELGKAYFAYAGDEPRILKEALNSFESALKIDPEDLDGLIFLAKTQCLLNDFDKAEENARHALLISPNRADIYHLLSEIAIRNNDYQGAYNYANKSIQLSPKDNQSTIILARSLSALGRHHEALATINTMLTSTPDTKSLHLERVNIVRNINGPKAGLDELIKLVHSFPDDFNVLNEIAKSYIELGETDKAITTALEALQTCTDKTPRNDLVNLHLFLGQILRQNGQLDQSIYHLSEAIQLEPDRLEPYLELGLARKERREYQQAIQIFEQATSIAPDDPRAPFQAGLALKESKDYKSSETMLRRAVNLAPHDLNIRRQLAAVVALNLVHNPRIGRN